MQTCKVYKYNVSMTVNMIFFFVYTFIHCTKRDVEEYVSI